MHVLFVSEYYPPKVMGGGEINLQLLAQSLAATGVKVSVLTAKFNKLPVEEDDHGVRVYRRLTTGSTPNSLLQNLKRLTRFSASIEREVDFFLQDHKVTHIHLIGAALKVAPRLKYLNLPLFATIESYPALCPKGDRIYHAKEECTITCTKKAFVICQEKCDAIGKMKNKWYLKHNPLFHSYVYHHFEQMQKALAHCTLIAISDYIQGILKLHGQESMVLPNILPIERFTPTLTQGKKIVYLGSLAAHKGVLTLLDALKGLDCECELYGEGVLKSELQKRISKEKLPAILKGQVSYDQIPQIYADADVIVFPSLWPEPFGRIAIEAMAAGKVVVASHIGAITELVKRDVGLLFEADSARALHNALKLALSDKERQKLAFTLGPEYAKTFSKEEIIMQLKEIYRQ